MQGLGEEAVEGEVAGGVGGEVGFVAVKGGVVASVGGAGLRLAGGLALHHLVGGLCDKGIQEREIEAGFGKEVFGGGIHQVDVVVDPHAAYVQGQPAGGIHLHHLVGEFLGGLLQELQGGGVGGFDAEGGVTEVGAGRGGTEAREGVKHAAPRPILL